MKSSLPGRSGKYRLFIICFISMPVCVLAQKAVTSAKTKPSYHVSGAGQYMRTWYIAGPVSLRKDSVPPDNEWQVNKFKNDSFGGLPVSSLRATGALAIDKNEYKWQTHTSTADIVDLDALLQGKDYAYAYAMAEIKTGAAAKVMLAIGSDDAVKVWLNGKQVHENWVPRGIVKDDDLVPLNLEKGSNQLLLKVQDIQGGWGFVVRLLDKAGLGKQLNTAAANGNLDKINLLLEHGADVNAASDQLTPIAAARVAGRNEVIQLLLGKGAVDQPVPSPDVITDNLYHSLTKKTDPGIALLVAKDGKVLYKKGFGFADIQNKIAVAPDTRFRIGSVTKQFTAAAILKLQEEGKLNVSDKLSKFIPDFPRGDEVTIHQLLTHISGIHSYTGKPDFLDRVVKTITPDSLIAYFKHDPYDFEPGEKFLYNNSGYFLLGYIISNVAGKPYDAYLKETFFDPLQMANTGVHYKGIKLDHEAKGYSRSDGKYNEALDWDMSWAGGAGAMYSTVDDLLKWNHALHNGKVLSAKSYEAAITPVSLKGGAETPMKYGYGLGLNKFRGTEVIGHSGGLHGFLTQLAYYPKEKLTVVMFTNTSDPEVNFNPDKVAEAFLWDKLGSQSSYAISLIKPKDLDRFTGRYELMNVGVLNVTAEGDRLFAQLSGQPRFEIFPSSEYEYFWKVVEARLKFDKSENGEINSATLFQGGQELKARRLPDEKIVTVDPATLDRYIGRYKLNDNITVSIIKEDNKLFAHPTGQQKLELSPLSDTEFVILQINARLSFVQGTDGKATGIKLNMNGQNSDLPRID